MQIKRYSIDRDYQTKAILENRNITTLIYTLMIITLLGILISGYPEMSNEIRVVFILGICTIPPAWYYFTRNFRNKISLSYEVNDGKLKEIKNSILMREINISNIKFVTKVHGAYKVEVSNDEFYISDLIEDLDELISLINPVG